MYVSYFVRYLDPMYTPSLGFILVRTQEIWVSRQHGIEHIPTPKKVESLPQIWGMVLLLLSEASNSQKIKQLR